MLRHLPNALTLSRLGLALAFPFLPPDRRLAAALAALATEYLDGALARAFKWQSPLGVLLDPVADKLFFASAAGTLLWSGLLTPAQLLALAVRDLAVAAFGLALAARGRWSAFQGLKPAFAGKATTTLQYACFLFLLFGRAIPVWLLALTAALGVLAAAQYFAAYRARLSSAPGDTEIK